MIYDFQSWGRSKWQKISEYRFLNRHVDPLMKGLVWAAAEVRINVFFDMWFDRFWRIREPSSRQMIGSSIVSSFISEERRRDDSWVSKRLNMPRILKETEITLLPRNQKSSQFSWSSSIRNGRDGNNCIPETKLESWADQTKMISSKYLEQRVICSMTCPLIISSFNPINCRP
jgi:hypothetical protein